MVVVGEFIGGAALGAAFGVLFDVVQKAVDKPTTFKSLLENIKFSLDFLKPVIEKIGQHNVELGLPDEEIKYLVKEMEEGVKLVQKSSKVSKWNCMKSYYTDQLIELDGSLKRLLHILMVQGVRDAKETLILARKHQDQLIESARDAKETLVLAQKNTDQLIESVEDGKETLVLARQNADQLIESARDGKETLVLTRQNNDQLVASARDGKETLVLARKIKRLLKQIERLVPCTNKGKTRYHSGNRVSKVSKNAGRSQIKDDQRSTNIVSDTSSSAGTCTSLLKTPTFQKDDQSTDDHISETSNLRVFSFAELKNATRNFREDTVLGEGGFGRVFKGWLDKKTLAPSKAGSGMIVAIKKRKPESLQGFEQWMSEVNILGRLSHFNIVKLLGFCSDKDELLLVYEYMQKGSLENHLFRRSPNFEPLSWDSRIKIAIGAARGLAFLHSPENQVIYRDFKTSKILIDGNYNAKLSGFGLAKLGPIDGDSHVSTRVIGTYGYAAPEYLATGHLYVKSDVYGFGVVLLEILTGLRVLDRKRPKEQLNLVDWTKPLLPHKGKLKAIMDARMEGQYSFKAAIQTANITLKCLAPDPQSRPSMKEVLEELEQIQAIRENPKPSVLITSRKPTSTPRSYVLQEPGRRILDQESGPDKYHATE